MSNQDEIAAQVEALIRRTSPFEEDAGRVFVTTDNGQRVELPGASTRVESRGNVRSRRSRQTEVKKLGQVAVLYSVLVGTVREFWVKTAKADVKVYEIPSEVEEPTPPVDVPPGWNCADGVSTYSAAGGPYATQAASDAARIPIHQPPQTTFSGGQGAASYDVSIGLSNGRSAYTRFRGPIGDFRITDGSDGLVRRVQCYATGANSGSACTTFEQFGGQGGWRNFFNSPDMPAGTTITGVGITHVSSCPGSDSTDTSPGIITGYNCGTPPAPGEPGSSLPPPVPPTMVPNPYEAFISALRLKVFALIKSGEDGTNFAELAYKQLVGKTVTDLGSTADPDDWRGLATSLTPTAEITDSDSCLEDYLASDDGALIDDKLYHIGLEQIINGQSLRDRLQASSDTIPAALVTQSSVVENSVCILGSPKESKIRVPSPGRGEIESITYGPPRS